MTKMGQHRTGKRKGIKPISDKMKEQKLKEAQLIKELVILQNGKCKSCGKPLGWGSSKHETIFRSHGGDPLSIDNCSLLCFTCHQSQHGINIVSVFGEKV
jgi:5-methylcytosine-specific restriction endonuclease McrA